MSIRIRSAQPSDYSVIKKIHDTYLLDVSKIKHPFYLSDVQKQGFIVNTGQNDLRDRISNSQIFDVIEKDNQIAGFIDINYELYFPPTASNIIWFSQKLKSLYFNSSKTTVLHNIITSPNFKQQGIARKLVTNSFNKLKKLGIKNIFSIVTTAPVTNCPSIIFHTNLGFSRACVTMPKTLFGLSNYQSLLFYKKI